MFQTALIITFYFCCPFYFIAQNNAFVRLVVSPLSFPSLIEILFPLFLGSCHKTLCTLQTRSAYWVVDSIVNGLTIMQECYAER
jgi:hypothetical protein